MAKKQTITPFKFEPFSMKQQQVLTWHMNESPVKHMQGIIADGAVRSGKTVSMALSFVQWGNGNFNDMNFGLCGKTISSLRRNVIEVLKRMLVGLGYIVKDNHSENMLTITSFEDGRMHTNHYYMFGGKDEGSQDLIQGITLAGVLFDEVALMPQSFVNQATARCSVTGSKMWFNCNPAGPYHWFKSEWVDKHTDKNMLYMHFTMDDNLSLAEEIKARFKSQYVGVFFKRYILGLWSAADGLIYNEFDEAIHCIAEEDVPTDLTMRHVGSDYGITNPHVYLNAGFKNIDGKTHCYIIDEYYNEGGMGKIKTDPVFVEDYKKFIGSTRMQSIIIDPSATSLINLMRQNNIHVKPANNEVIAGINNISMWLKEGRLHIVGKRCPNLLKEFSTYAWDAKAQARGEDAPMKVNDHALDAARYIINTLYPVKMPTRVRTV